MKKKREWIDELLKQPDPSTRSRFAIDNDKYDRETVQSLGKQIEDFKLAREKLAESKAGDLAYDAWQDIFLEFWKVEPELLPPNEVRPTHQINRVVAEEAQNLVQYKELRRWTQGDDIGSALACVTVEEDVEALYDDLEEQIQQALELEQALQSYQQAQNEQRDIEDMHKEWTEQPPEEREPIDWNQKRQEAQQKVEQQAQNVQQKNQEFQDGLEDARPGIRSGMKKALEKANDDQETASSAGEMWGLEPGELHRLPAERRIELAQKMNNRKFKRIAELFGPMKRLAFTEQRRKVLTVPEEIYDVELGNNISRLLPEELSKIKDKRRKRLFFKDFTEKRLLQYAMRGYEKIAKGGIIFVHDGSGSMSGDPEVWAKAVGLCLLHIAKKQKRSFWGIQFGSPGQIRVDDFTDSQNISPEKVIDFAEFFFGGGTDFQGPLSEALSILQKEHDKTGAIKSDIVFATDGQAGVDPQWLEDFKKEQERLGFTVWGITIGGEPRDEPINKICDGRVATIKSLTDGESVRTIFNNV